MWATALGLARGRAYDTINVAAAAVDAIPARSLAQLASGGLLVAPVDAATSTSCTAGAGGDVECTRLERVRFVPLT